MDFSRGGWEYLYAFLWAAEEHPEHIQEHSENCLLCHTHNLVWLCNQRRKSRKMLILSDTLPQNIRPLWERGFVLISIKRFLIASCGEAKPSAQPPLVIVVTFCSPQRLIWLCKQCWCLASQLRKMGLGARWAPKAGECNWGQVCLQGEKIDVLHYPQPHCQRAAKCFVLFLLWVYMKRAFCYNIDSLWEIIRHRKGPRETRGR